MNIQDKTFLLLEQTGLNWTVKKEELFSNDMKPTESFGVFRNDTNGWLGTVGHRYRPMQNYELAETIIEATESIDLVASDGGVLAKGKKVYLQSQLPDEYIGNSGVKRMITALNSHDGSTQIGFGSTSTVVICENTFFKAYQDVAKIRHTQSYKEKVQTCIHDLKKVLGLDQILMEQFKRMADVELKDEAIERVIRKIFTVDPNLSQENVSTRKFNQVNDFAKALYTEKNLEGNTLWALFNAVTRYTNHVITPVNKDDKLNHLMIGSGYKISNIGFDEIMEYISERTPQNHFILS